MENREAENSRALALSWWRDLDTHNQWLALERWRLLKEVGCDLPAFSIITSAEKIEQIWTAEMSRKLEKATRTGEEK